MALRPKIEECVGCFVCFNKNNIFSFNPTFLVAPLSVLQLKHHNLLEPRASSCAKNVQNENSVCGPAMWMEGGGWWWLVGAAILFWNQFGGSQSAPLQPSCPSTAAQ